MIRAIVLSGGGNYGALQAGALEALFAYGVQPDLLVGVSAGALNAAWLAAHPSLSGARQLSRIWREGAPEVFPPLKPFNLMLRLAQGKDSLLSNVHLEQFIRKWAPVESAFVRYGHPCLFVLAARLADGGPRVFGDDPADRLLDGLMASTALPPLFPPWEVDGVPYIDGGVNSDLPIRVAIERGAEEIYALHITSAVGHQYLPKGMFGIGMQALMAMINQSTQLEIRSVHQDRHVKMHLIRLQPTDGPGFWEFSHARSLIADGHRAAMTYLTKKPAEQPGHVLWRSWSNASRI